MANGVLKALVGGSWVPITPGPQGDKGDKGDQGIQGPVGPQGIPGDIAGPTSAVDGDVTVFNGTTGKVVKDSGIAVSRIALRDQDNVFAASQTINAPGSALVVLNETTAPVDAKCYYLINSNQAFQIWAINDARDTILTNFVFGRNGYIACGGPIYADARGTPMGYWVDVPIDPNNFSTDAGTTWTGITAPYNRYTIIGKTMIWEMYLNGGSSSAACNLLFMTIPGGFFSANVYDGPTMIAYASVAGTEMQMRSSTHPNRNVMQLLRFPAQVIPAGAIVLQFTIIIPIQ